MRRSLITLPLVALIVALMPASSGAITPAGFDCGPDDGRERLTEEGFHLEFEAPGTPATGHDVAAFVANLAGQESPYPQGAIVNATAHFPFRVFVAPRTQASVRVALGWEGDGDFDLDVYDDAGQLIAGSHAFNPLDGNGESVLFEASHCDDLSIHVQNYMGNPSEPLTLDVTVTPGGATFACEADDPHPACEGKVEGEAPAAAPDDRTRLYLGGARPGQAAMAGHYVYNFAERGEEPPFMATLGPNRPLGGRPNQFTHTALGFSDQNQNPFQANFTTPIAQPTTIEGDVHALVWLSSRTMQGVHEDPPGTVYLDLYADSFNAVFGGFSLGRVEIPGDAIGPVPTPFAVTFEDVDPTLIEEELSLQVASDPVATSDGETGSLSDAEWTVHYDSVQFPSRITLSLPEGALDSE